ncbi:hypothetical protein OS493_008030 [Desmophyllum pertusum]|uniref:Uncharacterized protein n=1 Tax=Desmophyllum pertusum TaxID=174260 RepID=A0A9W9YF22_9CNID|nr:hypothetical protein OS493_008030 [Desmophyllum pertusum]
MSMLEGKTVVSYVLSSAPSLEKTAATTIGRETGSDVWVINETTQINGKGDIVAEEDQEFVWIDDLFDDKVKTLEIIYPFKSEAINEVLQTLKETLYPNFMASFLTVAGSALGLHYERIIEEGHHYPHPSHLW